MHSCLITEARLANADFIETRLTNLKYDIFPDFIGHEASVTCIAFSSDGKYLASGARDNTVRIWIIETQKLLNTLRGHASSVWAVAISPDSKYLASGNDD
jgi:WD40 repeat protein